MKILVFGNSLTEQDNGPLKILSKLKKFYPNIVFHHVDPTENLLNHLDENKNLTIIDTVINTKDIQIIKLQTQEDFKKLILPKSLSMHDFDLAYNLRLLKKINQINKVKIICIPMNYPEQEVLRQLKNLIPNQ
jgi:Ni,Fe-hydrogenase maturation factor